MIDKISPNPSLPKRGKKKNSLSIRRKKYIFAKEEKKSENDPLDYAKSLKNDIKDVKRKFTLCRSK